MITTEEARTIIAAAEARATEIGVPVTVAVLDRGAHLKALSRMDGSVLGAMDVAIGKARTAVLFGIGSAAVHDYLAAAPGRVPVSPKLPPSAWPAMGTTSSRRRRSRLRSRRCATRWPNLA